MIRAKLVTVSLQFFFKKHGYSMKRCNSPGELADLFARTIEWVGTGMSGFTYTGKKPSPVRVPPCTCSQTTHT
jgi:hypothetical protein